MSKFEKTNLSIKDKFDQDKKFVLDQAEKYLNENTTPPKQLTDIELQAERIKVTSLVNEKNFNKALQSLEKIRDAKSGIIQNFVPNGSGTPTLIRDARSAKADPVRQTESFEMQYLNAIRSGMDLAEGNPPLQEALLNKVKIFFSENGFHTKTELSQKSLAKEELKNEINDIGVLIGKYGISQPYTKLNIAKDFQNFKDTHANVVTISSITHNGKSYTSIEAEVGMKGLTKRQKEEYSAIILNSAKLPKPNWYSAMPEWEQELCRKYAPIIADGKHAMPTQLRQMVGMKNAFEKITAIYNLEKSKIEVLHTSKHAGTLVSLARDKSQRQFITDENARQAQEWIGNSNKLHCNTFNSGPIAAGDDPEIVRRTTQAMKNVKGRETNTAFNAFRMIGSSSDLTGAKNFLNEISNSLVNDKDFIKVKSHLEPKGFFGRLMRLSNAHKELKLLLDNKKVNDATLEILKEAIELSKTIEKADKVIRLGDSENLSLQISTKLNNLSQKIINISEDQKLIGFTKDNLPKEEVLNMCASGKDRTGLAEHDQSAQAIAAKVGADVKDIDKQLLKGGHTAQQAGGIYAGGATIGCFGTKGENKAGLPKSRREGLEGIIEVSATSNKIKGNSKKIDKIIESKIVVKKVEPQPNNNANIHEDERIKSPISKKAERVEIGSHRAKPGISKAPLKKADEMKKSLVATRKWVDEIMQDSLKAPTSDNNRTKRSNTIS